MKRGSVRVTRFLLRLMLIFLDFCTSVHIEGLMRRTGVSMLYCHLSLPSNIDDQLTALEDDVYPGTHQ